MNAIPNRYTVNTPNGSTVVQVAAFDTIPAALECAKDQQSLLSVMGVNGAVQVFDTWNREIVGDGFVGDMVQYVNSQRHKGFSPVAGKYL